jgi:hypothetical protein
VKHKASIGLMLLISMMLVMYIGLVYATELSGMPGSINALGTGYAITRWPYSSGDVFIGDTVTVRACTTQPPYPTATQVLFRWIRPDGTTIESGPTSLSLSSDTWDGDPIYDAYDSQTLDQASTDSASWGVQALFIGADGKYINDIDYPIIKIRAISWHPVPEVPFGTVAVISTMIIAVGFYTIKKRSGQVKAYL